MAGSRKIKTRIIQKHAQSNVWEGTNDLFIPLEGELVVYDKDNSTDYPRLKIGDGSKNINQLPFITAGTAEKLKDVRKITLIGAIGGNVSFDGSSDVTINTQLNGDFEFTGDAVSHSHNINLTNVNLSGSVTPSGTISGSYKPEGSISAPDITLSPSFTTVNSLTSTGSYTPGSCTFPEIEASDPDSNGIVTISLQGGAYNPGTYIPPVSSPVECMSGVSASASAPIFTGSNKALDATFSGISTNIEVTGDISGESDSSEITPTGDIKYVL